MNISNAASRKMSPDARFNTCLQMVEASPMMAMCAIPMHDGRYQILSANSAYHKVIRDSVKNPIGRFLDELFERQESTLLSGHFDQCLNNGSGAIFTAEFSTPIGFRHMRVSLTPIPAACDHAACIYVVTEDISERKKIKAMLHHRTEEFRALVENSPDHIIRYDLSCRRIYINPAFLRLVDSGRDEILGETPTSKVVLLTNPSTYEAKIREVIESGEATELTFNWIGQDGQEYWTHSRFVPELDSGGRLASVLAIGHDVTKLKQTERQLATLVNNIPDMVSRFDLEGRHVYVNPTVCRNFARQEEDFLGKTPQAEDLDGTPLVEWIIKAAKTGQPNRCETIWHLPQGTRHYNVRHIPEKDENGQVVSVLGIATDMTELMQAQQALRESEEHYRQVFDHAEESLFLLSVVTSCQFQIMEVNPSFEKQVGYSTEDLNGKNHEETAPKEIMRILTANCHQCVETGSVIKEETLIDLAQGPRTFHLTLIPVRDTFGHIHRIVGMLRDITERRNSELAMKRLNRALKTLSSGNEALVRAANEHELLEKMCRVVVDIGGYQLAWIGLSQNDRNLTPVAWAGDDTAFDAIREYHQQTEHLSDTTTLALQTGAVQVIHDIENHSTQVPFHAALGKQGINACLELPLSDSSSCFGVVAIYSTDRHAFDDDEVSLLKEMADDLSYGIHALRERIEKERYVTRLNQSFKSTVEALASTIELRDPYTAGHQRRVAELAQAVCRYLDWPEDMVQATYLAGLVHDIGKIAIPAEILSKPMALNKAENQLVRTHSEAGYNILKAVDFDRPVALIIRQHHERLDGSGYPLGLKAEAIIPEARVLAVCDVVEAMTNHRPYRPGVGLDAALSEIKQGKSRLYDPQAVDACIDLFKQKEFRFKG
ncbi:MAG: PAS domain-containing protein [Candidatus Thiodiazotropha sp.]